MIVPDFDVVSRDLAETGQGAYGIVIIVEYRDVHKKGSDERGVPLPRDFNGPLDTFPAPAALSAPTCGS
jgi:hypothetical protein